MEVNISDEIGCWNREAIEAHAREISIREHTLQNRVGAEINPGCISCIGCIDSSTLGKVCRQPTIQPSEAAIDAKDRTADLGNQTQITGMRIIRPSLEAFVAYR